MQSDAESARAGAAAVGRLRQPQAALAQVLRRLRLRVLHAAAEHHQENRVFVSGGAGRRRVGSPASGRAGNGGAAAAVAPQDQAAVAGGAAQRHQHQAERAVDSQVRVR